VTRDDWTELLFNHRAQCRKCKFYNEWLDCRIASHLKGQRDAIPYVVG
jgi:hypothetical protein